MHAVRILVIKKNTISYFGHSIPASHKKRRKQKKKKLYPQRED